MDEFVSIPMSDLAQVGWTPSHTKARDYAFELFWAHVAKRGLSACVSLQSDGRVNLELASLPLAFAGEVNPTRQGRFYADRDAAAVIWLGAGGSEGWVGAATLTRAQELRDAILKTAVRKVATVGKVHVEFWTNGQHGPDSRRRDIETPTWDEIAGNYTQATSAALADLCAMPADASGGRLILFSGPPGVGKTHSLRALARAISPWCRTHYVIDPEQFFGQASYMAHVLMGDEAPCDEPDCEEHPQGKNPIWKLLVIEDADELITADAKERSGQAMGRLLNLTDGLIGQGLNVLVLITTNEDVGRFNPAVTRAGRCRANIEFGALSVAEANAWCKQHDRDPVSEPTVLADLYNRAPIKAVRERRAVGFGG